MNAVASGRGVATEAFVNIKTGVLVAGFSQAVLSGCPVSIRLLTPLILARGEVHPDHQTVPGNPGIQKRS